MRSKFPPFSLQKIRCLCTWVHFSSVPVRNTFSSTCWQKILPNIRLDGHSRLASGCKLPAPNNKRASTPKSSSALFSDLWRHLHLTVFSLWKHTFLLIICSPLPPPALAIHLSLMFAGLSEHVQLCQSVWLPTCCPDVFIFKIRHL